MVILGALAALPFALSAYGRETKGRDPQIHIVPDMDFQQKFKSQADNDFFTDGRSMRPYVKGTVAVGHLRDDDHLYRGKVNNNYAREFPKQIQVTAATMARGEQQFGIYCAPCHGTTGKGDGLVAQRADKLAEGTWVPPTDVRQAHLGKQPVGQLFHSISNGVRNMPGYGHQIDAEDRWAIVLYLRALQRSQNASINDVPDSQRAGMK